MTKEEFNALVGLMRAIASQAVYEADCRERWLFTGVQIEETLQYQTAAKVLIKESER